MIKPEEIREGLWVFPIVLPNNPLKWLNCYVIKGNNSSRNLLIDTGFYNIDCIEALLDGMEALGISPENTDVFLSHLHFDHTGNAAALYKKGSNILMSEIDYYLFTNGEYNGWKDGALRMQKEGLLVLPSHKMSQQDRDVVHSSGVFPAMLLNDGDLLCYGEYKLECVLTPGHTPGHMCLYDRETKTMFLGDHILFDITPNIGYWSSMEDSLGAYLDSLKKMSAYDIETALPAHRNRSQLSVSERIDQLFEHHKNRLEDILEIIAHKPYQNAYSIAGAMNWRIHSKNWDSCPPVQQYFAVNETVAHLDHLVVNGKIHRELNEEGLPVYFI